MRLLSALLALFALGGQQPLPPPYPRSGTTSLIDNGRVQVWDVSWPKGKPSPLHRHLYDMTGLYYWPGDRVITAVDGSTRHISTATGAIQWQLKGITHTEEGTSADSLRAVMIEIKGDGPSGKTVTPAGVPVFSAASMPLLDSERVVVWDYPDTAAPSRHAHIMDTVVVWSEGRSGHAIFLPAGTVHTPEPIGAGAKATIFELK